MPYKKLPPKTYPGVPGTIYLLHFERPLKHAQHYLGWTADLESRLRDHAKGSGSALMAAVKRAGIEWHLVKTWQGDTYDEKKLKQFGTSKRHCPVCRTLAGLKPEK